MRPGERLGPYTLGARLGSGGMASLFVATRRGPAGFEREVALKVLHPHLATDAETVRMFVDEARLASRIEHPNVVRVEELGHEDGVHYLVMERVRGLPLYGVLDRLAADGDALPVAHAVWIAVQVAEGLHAAHELTRDDGARLEVVHRDVSPTNVLVARTGHVRLIDFGIARIREPGRRRTTTRSLRGKLRYMSPEQADGRSIDRRTDVFALGVVLWEMLAGRHLFEAPSEALLLDRVRAAEVPSLHELRDDVPEALQAALRHALARDLEDRTPSAWALRGELLEACPEALRLDASAIAAWLRARIGELDAAPPPDRGEDARGELDDEATVPPRAAHHAPSTPSIVGTPSTAGTRAAEPAPAPTGSRRVALVALLSAALGAGALGAVWMTAGLAADEPQQALPDTLPETPPVQAPSSDAGTPEEAGAAIGTDARVDAGVAPLDAGSDRRGRAGERRERLLGVDDY